MSWSPFWRMARCPGEKQDHGRSEGLEDRAEFTFNPVNWNHPDENGYFQLENNHHYMKNWCTKDPWKIVVVGSGVVLVTLYAYAHLVHSRRSMLPSHDGFHPIGPRAILRKFRDSLGGGFKWFWIFIPTPPWKLTFWTPKLDVSSSPFGYILRFQAPVFRVYLVGKNHQPCSEVISVTRKTYYEWGEITHK